MVRVGAPRGFICGACAPAGPARAGWRRQRSVRRRHAGRVAGERLDGATGVVAGAAGARGTTSRRGRAAPAGSAPRQVTKNSAARIVVVRVSVSAAPRGENRPPMPDRRRPCPARRLRSAAAARRRSGHGDQQFDGDQNGLHARSPAAAPAPQVQGALNRRNVRMAAGVETLSFGIPIITDPSWPGFPPSSIPRDGGVEPAQLTAAAASPPTCCGPG